MRDQPPGVLVHCAKELDLRPSHRHLRCQSHLPQLVSPIRPGFPLVLHADLIIQCLPPATRRGTRIRPALVLHHDRHLTAIVTRR